MGHLNSNVPGTKASDEVASRPAVEPRRRTWLGAVVGVVVAALGYWYFRGPKASTEAQGPAAPGGSAKGQGRQGAGAGGFVVPVVVAAGQRGDLAAFLQGPETVTAVYK